MFQSSFFFFFNDTATTEIYTLSLHDALPISLAGVVPPQVVLFPTMEGAPGPPHVVGCSSPGVSSGTRRGLTPLDRKSTRLNSSHLVISYAVFCLKKKKETVKNDVMDVTISRR